MTKFDPRWQTKSWPNSDDGWERLKLDQVEGRNGLRGVRKVSKLSNSRISPGNDLSNSGVPASENGRFRLGTGSAWTSVSQGART